MSDIAPHPQDTTKYFKTTTHMKLEEACLAKTGQHFTQAAKTPFLHKPLISIFGKAMVYMMVFDQVLSRTFKCPSECDPMAQMLLKALAKPNGVTTIPTRPMAVVMEGWPLPQSNVFFDSTLGTKWAGMSNPTIMVFNAKLVDLGLTMGYSLKWWWMGLNAKTSWQPKRREGANNTTF